MLGVGVIFGLLSPVSKALLDSGLISPAGLMMTRTAGAAAAFWTHLSANDSENIFR